MSDNCPWNTTRPPTMQHEEEEEQQHQQQQQQKQEAEHYLSPLLRNLRLDDHQGDFASYLPNQYSSRSALPNYAIKGSPNICNNERPAMGDYMMPNLNYSRSAMLKSASSFRNCHNCNEWPVKCGNDINYCHYAQNTGASSSNDYNSRLRETRAAHHHHPTRVAPYWETADINPHVLDSQTLLDYFFCDPAPIMISRETNHGFLNLLNDKKQINAILKKILEIPDQILRIVCCHNLGLLAMKKLITVAKEAPRMSQLCGKLAHIFLPLVKHQYGRRVIEECFRQVDGFKMQPLYEQVFEHWYIMATDMYGCITLQTCMDFLAFSKTRLLAAIASASPQLALHQHGVFVLQHVIPMNIEPYDREIVEKLRPYYSILCTTKSGSYLVEKYVYTPFRSPIAAELLQTDTLVCIAGDPCGNYVIQKLLKETKIHDGPLYERLYKKLLQNMEYLKCNPFGKKVAILLEDQTTTGYRRIRATPSDWAM